MHTTRTLARLRGLFLDLQQDQAGSSALEYVLMLALVALGTTSILGNAAGFFYNFFQTLISSVTAVWPS